MSKVNRVLRMVFLVGIGAALGGLLIYWLLRLFQQEEETEEAVRVSTQRLAEIPIPLSPDLPDEDIRVSAAPKRGGKGAAWPGGSRDDLTQITGIGPKYAAALQSLGIVTYGDLARQEPHDLATRLREKGVRIIGDRIVSEDWMGQAGRLASESKG